MPPKKAIVLSLCDFTGNTLKPWAETGDFRCIAVDLQHRGTTFKDGIEFVGANILDFMPPNGEYFFVAAAPPCTDLAVSGARWFAEKGLVAAAEAFMLVERCKKIIEWSDAPSFIENPVSTLSTYWRQPDYYFEPYDYGDPYTKRTCLWTFNGFVMPPKQSVFPSEGSKMHLIAPSDDRANIRSETPMGFARAIFRANTQIGGTA